MRAGSEAQRRSGRHAQHNQARHPKPSSGRGAKSIPATGCETTSGLLQPGVLHAEAIYLPSRAPNRPENAVPNAPVSASRPDGLIGYLARRTNTMPRYVDAWQSKDPP
jgi:hypothetical protein